MKMQNGASPTKISTSSSYSNISKQSKIRCSIIEEIVKSEEEYLDILHYVVDVIKAEFERCAEHIEYEIDEGHVRALFGNITDLLDVHESLLHALNTELGRTEDDLVAPEDALRKTAESSVGLRIVERKDSFKVYEIYCANHARAEKVASDIVKMSSLKSKLEKWAAEGPLSNITTNEVAMLDMLLAQPLHHICKLNVLLRMLAVFTPANHPDLEDVFSAVQLAQACMTAIESGKRGKILQKAFHSCDDLQMKWDDVGFCNQSGFLTKRGGNVKNWKIRWFTLRSYELKYFDEPAEDRALNTLDLHHCTAVVESDSQAKPNCFGLVFSERTYYMYAVSPEQKAEWMNLIAWKIYIRQTAEERARLTLSVPLTDTPKSVLQLLK